MKRQGGARVRGAEEEANTHYRDGRLLVLCCCLTSLLVPTAAAPAPALRKCTTATLRGPCFGDPATLIHQHLLCHNPSPLPTSLFTHPPQVAAAAFDLLFAFDEVISLGHKENVTVAQVSVS